MNKEEAIKDFSLLLNEIEFEQTKSNFNEDFVIAIILVEKAERLLNLHFNKDTAEYRHLSKFLKETEDVDKVSNLKATNTLLAWTTSVLTIIKVDVAREVQASEMPAIINQLKPLSSEQSAKIIEAIQAKGYNQLDFKRTFRDKAAKFVYKDSPLWFEFDRHETVLHKFATSYTRADGKFTIEQGLVGGINKAVSFVDALTRLSNWLDHSVKLYDSYTSDPDPWELLVDESRSGNKYRDTGEEFTTKEKDLLKERLDILERVLADQFDLHDEEIASLKVAISELKEQMKKQSKPIWQRIAKTIVIDVIKDVAKDSEKQHQMIEAIKGVFSDTSDILPRFLS